MIFRNDFLWVHHVYLIGSNARVKHRITNDTVAEFKVHDQQNRVNHNQNCKHGGIVLESKEIVRERGLGRCKPKDCKNEKNIAGKGESCVALVGAHESCNSSSNDNGQLEDVSDAKATGHNVPKSTFWWRNHVR